MANVSGVVLVTGSSGLVGSEAVVYFDGQGREVHGVDNNMRRAFFGPTADTTPNRRRLESTCRAFEHHEVDVRDREAIFRLFERLPIDLVVHCAAQPSHDLARERPLEDFDVNAVGTFNLLEAARRFRREAVFCHMSTNKVYGDAPNERPLVEHETRWDYRLDEDHEGIDEHCRIDRSEHSMFGASKTAADVIAQEYARCYGLKVGVFRAGCITGRSQAGSELHGFMNYLVRVAAARIPYRVYGYKGKQLRDHIHSHDVVRAFDAFARAPRPGEVYNIGGGRANSASVLECIATLERLTGRPFPYEYVDTPRRGDHICYVSDVRKLKAHFPDWRLTRGLPEIWDDLLGG